MMGLLDRLFSRRERDVSAVYGPTEVTVTATVVSPDTVVSPVTGTRASLVRWTLLEERSHHAGRGGGVVTRYDVISTGRYEGDVLRLAIDGRTVEVPLAYAELELIEDPEDGQLLGILPAALAGALRAHVSRGPIAYRESWLRAGDTVELTATLEREVGASATYREAASEQLGLRVVLGEKLIIREV